MTNSKKDYNRIIKQNHTFVVILRRKTHDQFNSMRILQLCKKFPYPLKDGESIAVTNLSRALTDLDCEVTLLTMNTSKHYFNPADLPRNYNRYHAIHAVKVDNRVKVKDAFINLFSEQSYHVSRFISKDFEDKLIELLNNNQYDIIQMETPILAPYLPVIRRHTDAPVAMRSHNVEHEIWQRIADNTVWQPKKAYLQNLAKKLRRFETGTLKNFDLLVPITRRDEHTFQDLGYRGPSVVTPIGINGTDYQPDLSSFQKPVSLSFIGSLDWIPNQEGLLWFLENVWPEVSRKHPELEFHIAGRNTPASMLKMKIRNVTFHGEVECSKDFLNAHSIMVVPLLSGSGMRVKILEGMALGKVVLTTSIGVEGIEAGDRQEILRADSPQAFIEQLDFAVKNKAALPHIGSEARELLIAEYDNLNIARRLKRAYSDLRKSELKEQAALDLSK